MKSVVKVKCDKCHCKIARWEYIPHSWRYYCDDCVPRGCSCNLDDNGVEIRDEQGRLLPCCEYDYSPNGWTANFLLHKGRPNARWVHVFMQRCRVKFYICWRKIYCQRDVYAKE